HRALDAVLELAHVARPAVRLDRTDRIGREPARRLAEALADLLQQELRQQQAVALPLAQRWHAYGDLADPVVEIVAEVAGADQRLELAVGCADDAQIERDRRAAADALHRPFLHHAQQLRLQQRRHLADLIQKYRAAVGE